MIDKKGEWDAASIISVLLLAAILAFLLCCSGCGTKTVYVPDGMAVRLAQDIGQPPKWWPFSKWPGGAGVEVWVKGDDGKLVKGRMILPEGWYVLPMPDTEVK
jgi:hypothetical protein